MLANQKDLIKQTNGMDRKSLLTDAIRSSMLDNLWTSNLKESILQQQSEIRRATMHNRSALNKSTKFQSVVDSAAKDSRINQSEKELD